MRNHNTRVFSDFMELRRTEPDKYYNLTTQRSMYNAHRQLGSEAFFDQATKR